MKTVLITGGATGIGRAACRLFAAQGYQVAIHFHTSRESAYALAQELNEAGFAAQCFQADLRQEAEVQGLFRSLEQAYFTLDAVINNAGASAQALFTDITRLQWDTLFAVNVTSAFLVSQEAVKRMLPRQNGAIVNISSMWGQVGASCEVAYSASKAALIGMTKALAKETGLSGIRVNCVCPGFIDTAMNAAIAPEIVKELQAETPLNRLGTPEDVAQAIYFLADSQASFITGQVLGVNGGLVIV